MRKYKGKQWSVVRTDQEWQFDFDSESVTDLYGIDWEKAVGVQKSRDGSQGVYFVSTPQGAVVVKGSNSSVCETFCAIVAEKFSIRAPKCRVVVRKSAEGALIYDSIVTLDDAQPLYRTARQSLHRHVLLLMEFCSGGKSMKQISREQLEDIMGKGEICFEIGKIAAFDMLMRNTDRFPIVVDNRGNPGNILFGREGEVFCIDNNCVCIDIERNRDMAVKYCESVCVFLRQLFAARDKVHPSTTFVRSTILQYVGYDIGEEGLNEVQRGIISVVEQSDSISDLTEIKESVCKLDVETDQDNIRLDFLHLMLTAFRRRGVFEITNDSIDNFK